MENQYGITVANKYALFLNEDEDPLEILKLQEATKTTKKSEKSKKTVTNENEVKTTSNKQNAAPSASSQKKSEKIDNFSSPSLSDEKSRGKDKESDSLKQTKDRPKRLADKSNVDQQKQKNADGSPSVKSERPPRRERQDRGGFSSGRADRERRSDRQDDMQQERASNEQTDQGPFDRPMRDGFANRPPRYERAGFRGRPRGFNRGGFADRSERSGFDEPPAERTFYGGDRPPRRGGFRGRRGDRAGFGDRSERTEAEDAKSQDQGDVDEQQGREMSNQPRDRGGFGEWRERQGFDENVERSGFDDRGGGREFVRRGRGGGRGGFGRGRGGFDRPGKRDFDRHTEGGMRPADKRDGAGSHNWGTVVDDMEGQETDEKFVSEGGTTWAEQTDAEERAAAAERDGETGGQPDEEAKVMTLDEWKSMEEAKRVKAEFNIRKPGEGCSGDPQWKKMYMLTKKEKVEAHEDEDDQQEYDDRHGKQKNVLNIDIRFADNPRRGGGGGSFSRGGGRGGRGGRGRGGPDSYRESQYRGGYRDDRPRARSSGSHRDRAPNVADEMDFPSLDTIKA